MLTFLSSLFSTTDNRPAGVDDALIDAAIERVVDGTDRRLKGMGGYRRQLRPAVEAAVVHVIRLVDGLPAPVEVSRRTFGSDPRLHAFFASYNHMQEKVHSSRTVDAYLKQSFRADAAAVYGVLSLQREEARRLGTVLQGDSIQREVEQVVVNFLNHNYLGPSYSIDETLLNVKKRAFDFMINIAMERIIAERSKRTELEVQMQLLKRKLGAMKGGNWGLEEMLRPEMSGTHDLVALSTEIDAVDAELASLGASHKVLDRNMQIIRDTLSQPQEIMAVRNISMTLDSMNIRADAASGTRVYPLELQEIYSGIGASRIVLPGWLPTSEIPERPDFITEARRYL